MPETAIRRIPFPLREGELLRSCHRPPPVRTDRKTEHLRKVGTVSLHTMHVDSRIKQAKDYLDGAARQRPLECVENVRLFL